MNLTEQQKNALVEAYKHYAQRKDTNRLVVAVLSAGVVPATPGAIIKAAELVLNGRPVDAQNYSTAHEGASFVAVIEKL